MPSNAHIPKSLLKSQQHVREQVCLVAKSIKCVMEHIIECFDRCEAYLNVFDFEEMFPYVKFSYLDAFS